MITVMRRTSRLVLIVLLALVTPARAAVEPTADCILSDRASGDLHRWQRIDVRSSRPPRSQIKIIIRTKGPSIQGLIRIPGAPASNFDTGRGLTVVDLINTGDEENGYTKIFVLEILFTQRGLGQSYEAYVIDRGDGDDQ